MPNTLIKSKTSAYMKLRRDGKFQCQTCLIIDILENKYKGYALCIPCAKKWDSDRKTHSARHYESIALAKEGRYRCNICKDIKDLTNKDKHQGCCRQCLNAAKLVRKHRRRAREKAAQGSFTKEQLKARFDYYGNKCIYCKATGKLTVDHLIPICRGGSNFPSNLVPACRKCNSSKNKRTYKEFKAGGVCPIK